MRINSLYFHYFKILVFLFYFQDYFIYDECSSSESNSNDEDENEGEEKECNNIQFENEMYERNDVNSEDEGIKIIKREFFIEHENILTNKNDFCAQDSNQVENHLKNEFFRKEDGESIKSSFIIDKNCQNETQNDKDIKNIKTILDEDSNISEVSKILNTQNDKIQDNCSALTILKNSLNQVIYLKKSLHNLPFIYRTLLFVIVL